jgi:outer membrane protein insertion porin family
MGYFNPQKIDQDVRPNITDGTVDIEWKLEEQSSDQIELSGGWGGYYGFVGTVGLTFNNFSVRNVPHLDKWKPLPTGDGQRLSLRLQANGRSFQSYSLSFTEPWLGGRKPNSLTVSLNNSISRYPNSHRRIHR